MQFFDSKKVLITGASSGIGLAFSHLLASYGAELIITARRTNRLEKVAKELKAEYNTTVWVISCDLSDPAGPRTLYKELEERGLEVDILINNAGFGFNGRFEEGTLKNYELMMQVNVNALVALTRLLLPGMIQRNSGGILNVASVAGFMPIPNFSVYSATKQFVINFSWSLWREMKNTGVHVSVLCPGPVDTEFMGIAGVNKSKAAIRGLQSPDTVALKGLKGLAGNRGMAFSRVSHKLLYLLGKWLPVKAALSAGELAMRK